eukprot:TRINITY_DN1862_c0_g1_i1.p1 TRINITY_DN1862_c0_g1~~TRINITY_DN1862_c0_g1_i1.p1  ORF type:complete len:210 (+),score=66.81 TRINITY_DN1862_c0_g1_i1:32-631(+)
MDRIDSLEKKVEDIEYIKDSKGTFILNEARKLIPCCTLHRVPSSYYDETLEWRADVLKAPSIHHLCKTLIIENVKCLEPTKNYPRYIAVVVGYTSRISSQKLIRTFLSLPGNEDKTIKQHFAMSSADAEVCAKLTGFEFNAVTPFGLKFECPVVLSKRIFDLTPNLFFLGGGEIDLKLRVDTQQFVDGLGAIIADIDQE